MDEEIKFITKLLDELKARAEEQIAKKYKKEYYHQVVTQYQYDQDIYPERECERLYDEYKNRLVEHLSNSVIRTLEDFDIKNEQQKLSP